jgi:iron complex transport system substrate-binding protein
MPTLRRRFATPLMVLSTVVLLSACGSATNPAIPAGGPSTQTSPGGAATTAGGTAPVDPTPIDPAPVNPRSVEGPSTAVLPLTDVQPVTADPQPVLPATVTDNQGTKVTVRSDDRILALDRSGTLAATVYGLGLGPHLVGRDQSTGFPAAASLPLVTSGAHVLSAEAILALHPTVIITDTTLGPWDVLLQMRDSGIPVVVVTSDRDARTVDTLTSAIAAALGVSAQGDLLNTRVTREITQASAQITAELPADPAQRPRIVFLYVRGQAGTYYIFGKGSGADSLIDAVGGIDVATEAGLDGYQPLTAEALASLKPDVLLFMTEGLKSVGGIDGALRLPGVAETPAGQHRRIVDMNDYEVLAFGPRTASVIDALATALYR